MLHNTIIRQQFWQYTLLLSTFSHQPNHLYIVTAVHSLPQASTSVTCYRHSILHLPQRRKVNKTSHTDTNQVKTIWVNNVCRSRS